MHNILYTKLYKHQQKAIELYPNKPYLAWEVGLGKTLATLAIADHNKYKKLLIVAPKSAHQSWIEENKPFNFDLQVITYEHFRDKIEKVSAYDLVVFDEAHRLSYPKTKWTKKALQLRKEMNNIIMLSGTPADKLHKIYMQIKILTNGQDEMFIDYPSYTSFINAFFYVDEYFKPRRPLTDKARQIIKEWFDKYAYSVKKEDVLELPDIFYIDVKLPKTRLQTEVKSNSVAQFITDYRASSQTKEKIEYVLDFIEENPNTIVFSLFKDFVKIVGQKLGKSVYTITSETPDNEVKKAIQLQDKPIVSTFRLAEGANLQRNYSNIVYASLPLSYTAYEQSIGRVYRAGQSSKVSIFTLLQNKQDYLVKDILNNKKDVVEYLKENGYE